MTSTASPHWEVVGKGKKSKIPTPVSRGERKKLVDGMPKVEHYGKNQQVSTSPLFLNIWIESCYAIAIARQGAWMIMLFDVC